MSSSWFCRHPQAGRVAVRRRTLLFGLAIVAALQSTTVAQTPKQPKVAPGPGEPNWDVLLKERYGLSMFDDLLNPVTTTPENTPGLFKKAGKGDVVFTPIIALGLPSRTRGGWYTPGVGDSPPKTQELWSYVFKNTTDDLKTNKNLPPPLAAGASTSFDPKNVPFGLWVSNDEFKDGGVFTQPQLVAAINARLAKQPYKAMIYPNRDKATGRRIPHSYLIGWEYSTNDDFQDVVCQIDNVDLIEPEKPTR